MKHIALAAAAALGLSATVTPTASAETFSDCRERWEADCAMFVPRGSANWAACVEFGIELECQYLDGAALVGVEEILGRLGD